MAGLIREEDIALVRERADLVDIIGSYVTLKSAGGGSLKGLCPFHDERTPSFNVRPGRGWHCFGCGEGGSVIDFVMKHDGLTFVETVQYLADKYGITLRYTEGSGPERPKRDGNQRQRLVAANRAAQEFYLEQLQQPEAQPGREFLIQRGFDREVSETFGVGFAPRGGEDLYKHLRGRGFTDAELVGAGLVGQGQRGHYDRFRGRLLWPIRDSTGDVLGFGARKIFDDDRIEAKYLNTPETSLYKKSQVLYGIDLARREIARTKQAVVVEGYTDVMACHVAGVTTAVASCGTAFGEEHGKILRRFLLDHDEFRGEIIFTFDGDDAGQKAALKVFDGDQQYVSQTYVAVEPDGLDPCDLRLQKGDEAVRELVARRTPLYRFVLGNVVARYDLDRADGRVDALRAAARLVTAVRDRSKVDAFIRELAGMVGVDVEQARAEVRRASAPPQRGRGGSGTPGDGGGAAPPASAPRPGAEPMVDPRDPRFALERDVLKLVVQHPTLVAPYADQLGSNDFSHPAYAAVWGVVEGAGGLASAGSGWADALRAAAGGDTLGSLVSALAVESLHTAKEPDAAYAAQYVYRLLEVTAARAINELKSRLQRTNPIDEQTEYNRMFGDLVALEQRRRTLREAAIAPVE